MSFQKLYYPHLFSLKLILNMYHETAIYCARVIPAQKKQNLKKKKKMLSIRNKIEINPLTDFCYVCPLLGDLNRIENQQLLLIFSLCLLSSALREKWPNKRFFLVRIFRHLDWIRRGMEYGASLHIHSECRKIRTRKNSVFGHFSRSAGNELMSKKIQNLLWVFVKKFYFS